MAIYLPQMFPGLMVITFLIVSLYSLSQKNNKKQANQITVLNKYFVLIG